jgi:uncharacterized protein (DUF427 family)
MARPAVRLPGPDHPITIRPTAARVVVTLGAATLADSRAALTLQEAGYPAVQYIPRADVDMGALQRTAQSSHCPYKGDASYYAPMAAGEGARSIAWSYETPYPAMARIAGYLAFYPDRVDSIEQRQDTSADAAPARTPR